MVKCLSFPENEPAFGGSPLKIQPKNLGRKSMVRQSATSASMLVHEIRKLEMRQRQLGEEATHALELLHKEVTSHRIGSQDAAETIAKLLSEIKGMQYLGSVPEKVEVKDKGSLKEEIARLNCQENIIASLEQKLESVQRSIDKLATYLPSGEDTPDSRTPGRKKKILPFTLSNSANMPSIIRSPCSPASSHKILECGIENRTPVNNNNNNVLSSSNVFKKRRGGTTPPSSGEANGIQPVETSPVLKQSQSINVRKMQNMFKKAAEENIRSIKSYVTELKERVAKLQYQKQLLVCQVLQLEEANEAASDQSDTIEESPLSWQLLFEEQKRQIIELWHLCHVSLVHRTQFYLLFRGGDPSDQIYLEVELRRLTWLEQHLADLGNASPALLGDDPATSVSSSIRALKQEREYLARRVSSKLTAEEREVLYLKWDIPPEAKQRRRLQLVNKLWTDPRNMHHVKESAEIVAKLVGFCETGDHVSKEMFALNFVSLSDKKTWMGWNLISNLLHL